MTADLWNSGDMKHGPELSFDDDGRPVLITRAAQPYEEQHRAAGTQVPDDHVVPRSRAASGAAVAYGIWHNGLISLAILVASIPLPWIAVLIANDRPPRTGRRAAPLRRRGARIPLFPTAERPALEARSATCAATRVGRIAARRSLS